MYVALGRTTITIQPLQIGVFLLHKPAGELSNFSVEPGKVRSLEHDKRALLIITLAPRPMNDSSTTNTNTNTTNTTKRRSQDNFCWVLLFATP
jgi:hypothetical protein